MSESSCPELCWQHEELDRSVLRCDFGALSASIQQTDLSWKCSFTVDNDPWKVIDAAVYPKHICLSSIQSYAERYGKALHDYLSAHAKRLKKLQERVWLEQARRLSTAFPECDGVDSEEPDFLLRNGSTYIGIEITGLWQPAIESKFTPRTLAGNYESIVKKAKQRYEAIGGTPKDVRVLFSPDAGLERNPRVLIGALAHFVQTHSVIRGGTSWDTLSQNGKELPSGFESIGIHPTHQESGEWHCSHSGNVFPLTYEEVAREVAEKNDRLTSYQCNAAVNWLLLVVDFVYWGSPSVPRIAEEWRFTSEFQKVFLFCREHGQVLDVGA